MKDCGVQAHKLLTRDEEQVLSKYIVEMRPYDIYIKVDILMQGGKEQPPDTVSTVFLLIFLATPFALQDMTRVPVRGRHCVSAAAVSLKVQFLPLAASLDCCIGKFRPWAQGGLTAHSVESMQGAVLLAASTTAGCLSAMHPSLTRTCPCADCASVQLWADACGFQGHHEAFITKVRRCRQAKEIFEYCNLRMVAKIAHRYQGQGVEMEVGR